MTIAFYIRQLFFLEIFNQEVAQLNSNSDFSAERLSPATLAFLGSAQVQVLILSKHLKGLPLFPSTVSGLSI